MICKLYGFVETRALAAASNGTPFPARQRRSSVARPNAKVRLNQKGQAVSDYTVLLVAILLLVIGVARLAGNRVHDLFSNVANSFQSQPRGD